MILLDANVLLRLGNKSDSEYQRIQRVIFKARATDILVLTPQSLFEFWAVATRAQDVNGLGMEPARARSWIQNFVRMFPLLSQPVDLVRIWVELVDRYNVKGFRAHDARYVAIMHAHGISKLMTYNVKHFEAFPITILNPGDPSIFP